MSKMSWCLVEFTDAVDAGKRSVVSSDWIMQGKKGTMVHWRVGKKPWKSYPATLIFQGTNGQCEKEFSKIQKKNVQIPAKPAKKPRKPVVGSAVDGVGVSDTAVQSASVLKVGLQADSVDGSVSVKVQAALAGASASAPPESEAVEGVGVSDPAVQSASVSKVQADSVDGSLSAKVQAALAGASASAPTESEASLLSSAGPSAHVESSPSIFGPSPQNKRAISIRPMGCRTSLFAGGLPDIFDEIDGARKTQDNAIVGLGLFRYNISMDGNCLFRAIGAHLQGQEIHLKLREAAASWIDDNEDSLRAQNLLEDDGEAEATRKAGCWPGLAAITAMANILHTPIEVVYGNNLEKITRQLVSPSDGLIFGKTIIISYLYCRHYDALFDKIIPNPVYEGWLMERRMQIESDYMVAKSTESHQPVHLMMAAKRASNCNPQAHTTCDPTTTQISTEKAPKIKLTELYKRSKAGILYKRKEKHSVPCPICGHSTQWVSRHLQQVHNKGKLEAAILLNNVDSYRRRKGNSNPKPKLACPWPGCLRYVVCVADHVRRFHKESVRVLGDVERKVLPVSKGVTDTVSVSVTKGFTDNLLVIDLPPDQIITIQNEAPIETHAVVYEVPLMASETAAFPVESHEEEGEEAVVSPGVPPKFDIVLGSFQSYMSSIEAGSKARPDMYVLGARQVMEAVGMDYEFLTRLYVRKRFYEPLQEKITSKEGYKFSIKTVRNKLKCLEYFCTFLASDFCTGWMLQSWLSEIKKLRDCLPGWRQALRGQCTLEELHRRVLDGQEPVTRDDITKYRESQYSVITMQILRDRCQQLDSTPAVADFLRCRNHMIVLLSVSNAHRSGVMRNFTTNDYEQGLRAPRSADGSTCFQILNHKTATTHGIANIAVNQEEAGLLASYMSMRNGLDAQHIAPFVFVNSTGTQMSASNIGSALTTAFSNSGYNERVTCSKLRKAAVTEIHANHPSKKGDIAAHMCHREATAAKYYKMIANQNNSLDSVNLLRQAFTEKSMQNAVQPIKFPVPPVCASVNELTAHNLKNKRKATEDDDTGDDCDSSDDQDYKHDDDDETDDYVPHNYPANSRGRWSLENTALIKEQFADIIAKHSAPMSEITLRLHRVPDLRKKLEQDLNKSGYALARAVRDKVRTFYRHIYGFQKGGKNQAKKPKLDK